MVRQFERYDLSDLGAKWHYPVAITDVLVNGKQSVYAKMSRENNVYKIKLEADQRNLTIRFSGFTYSEPAYMSYKCKMEGIDSDWQLLSGQSEITYPAIISLEFIGWMIRSRKFA